MRIGSPFIFTIIHINFPAMQMDCGFVLPGELGCSINPQQQRQNFEQHVQQQRQAAAAALTAAAAAAPPAAAPPAAAPAAAAAPAPRKRPAQAAPAAAAAAAPAAAVKRRTRRQEGPPNLDYNPRYENPDHSMLWDPPPFSGNLTPRPKSQPQPSGNPSSERTHSVSSGAGGDDDDALHSGGPGAGGADGHDGADAGGHDGADAGGSGAGGSGAGGGSSGKRPKKKKKKAEEEVGLHELALQTAETFRSQAVVPLPDVCTEYGGKKAAKYLYGKKFNLLQWAYIRAIGVKGAAHSVALFQEFVVEPDTPGVAPSFNASAITALHSFCKMAGRGGLPKEIAEYANTMLATPGDFE